MRPEVVVLVLPGAEFCVEFFKRPDADPAVELLLVGAAAPLHLPVALGAPPWYSRCPGIRLTARTPIFVTRRLKQAMEKPSYPLNLSTPFPFE